MHLFSAGQNLGQEKVWYGDRHEVAVGSAKEEYLSLPKSEADKLKAQYVVSASRLDAPLTQGQTIGEIRISDNGKLLKTLPLVALQPVQQGGVFSRLMDFIKLKI